MSGDEEGPVPGPARPVIMAAGETFDGRERVLSRAAFDLQVRATSDSVSRGHAGFVPDGYLAGHGDQAAVTAAELCAAGMWERADGGYRVLDTEAVQVCLDHARQARSPALPPPPRSAPATSRMPPAYDGSWSDDLAGRLYGLVIRFTGRLPADQAQWLHHVIDIGEYDLAVEDLAAMIPHGKIAVTGQERADITALARQLGIELSPGWAGWAG